jgi:hypothetical protein
MAHEGPIRSLIQLKDHNLASGSDDKTIKILDLSSMWFCATFSEHKGSVKALAQLLDERLVSGSSDKTIKIWSLKRKKIEGSVNIGEVVTSLLVVNQSGLLLVGCKKIKVFNMSNREQYNNVFDLKGHNTEVNKMINVGVDGERVISAGKGAIKIWNMFNKTLETQLDAHKGGNYGLEIMMDGRLVTSGGDGQLRVWDILGEGGNKINLKTGAGSKKVEESYNKVGKVTYAYKDDIKRHDLAKIEKNINQNRINNQERNKNNKTTTNPFKTMNSSSNINTNKNSNKNTNTNTTSNNSNTGSKKFNFINPFKVNLNLGGNKNTNTNSNSNKNNNNNINNNTTKKTMKKSATSENLASAKAGLKAKGWVFYDK